MFDTGATRRHKLALLPVLIVWLAVAPSCKATPPTAPDPTLIGISILYRLPFSPEIGSADVFAYAVDSDGGYTDVTGSAQWSSSAPGLVDISSAGLQGRSISIRGIGPFRILATHQGVAGELLINKLPFPLRTTMRLTPAPGSDLRGIGATMQIEAEAFRDPGFYDRVTTVATWTSSDPAVATVERGRITALSVGTIEVRATYQGLSNALLVSVRPGAPPQE